MWVSPFRNLRIIGYLLLPVAYRSLSRLSSALSAKASTLRSSSLNQIYLDLRVRVRYLTCIALHALIGCVYICKPRCLSWHYQYLLILDMFSVFDYQCTTISAVSQKSVGLSGLEPPTSRLSGVRSNRLSYKPINPAATCSPISSPT